MFRKALALMLSSILLFVGLSFRAFADNTEVTEAELSGDGFVKCAESSLYELYVIGDGERSGEFYVKNKSDGVCHYSNPQNRDFGEFELLDWDKESSQFLLQVYNEESGAIRTINSFRGSDSGEYVTVYSRNGGFDSEYVINEAIKLTLEIRLTEKGFTVESRLDEVNNSDETITVNIQLLPYFDCALYGEEGYSLVPDGSGALIYNNTSKNTASKYSAKVYGEDLAFAQSTKAVDTQTVHLPVFGAKNKNGGYIAVIEEGAESALINAVSAYSSSMYNMVYPTFEIVASDKISFGSTGGWADYSSATETYECDVPLTDGFKVTYLLTGKGEGYSEMAELYREHLGLKSKKANDTPSIFIELYGGLSRKESFLGIPLTVFKRLTTVEQAKEIAAYFADKLDGDLVVSYLNCDSAVIGGKIQNKFRLKSALGSKKELASLRDSLGGRLYLENNVFSAKKGGNGFSVFSDVALRINRNNITSQQFDIATTAASKDKKASYAVNSATVERLYGKYFKSVKGAGFETAFINLANTSYSDFNKKAAIARSETVNTFSKIIAENGENGLLYAPNSYALSYGAYIADTPIYSSGYDITDEDVPFYQMVLSGVKEYSTVSLNLNTNTEDTFLKALESGASLKFTFVCGNITSIKNTEYEFLYGADFEGRKEQAAEYQKKLEKAYAELGSRTVKAHTVLASGVRATEYENGATVIVNYNKNAVDTEYGRVEPKSFIVKK